MKTLLLDANLPEVIEMKNITTCKLLKEQRKFYTCITYFSLGTKVLLGREYAHRPIFSGLRYFNEPEISNSGPTP